MLRALRMAWLQPLLAAAGLLLVLVWLARGRPSIAAGDMQLPARWELLDGIGVLVRGVLLLIVAVLVLAAVLPEPLAGWSFALGLLPLLLLARRHLLAPQGIRLGRCLGVPAEPVRTLGVALGLLGLAWAGALALQHLALGTMPLPWTFEHPEPFLTGALHVLVVTGLMSMAAARSPRAGCAAHRTAPGATRLPRSSQREPVHAPAIATPG